MLSKYPHGSHHVLDRGLLVSTQPRGHLHVLRTAATHAPDCKEVTDTELEFYIPRPLEREDSATTAPLRPRYQYKFDVSAFGKTHLSDGTATSCSVISKLLSISNNIPARVQYFRIRLRHELQA
eukprot:2775680-Pyramimonas_sp.AAC.1